MPKGPRILFVEDDANLQKSLAYILDREGYSVTSCSGGREALAIARADAPDLILLDLVLPDISGFEVCRELKRDSRLAQVLIVMLTGKALVEEIVSGLRQYADDYITKPFEPAILLARLQAVLRRRHQAGIPSENALQIGELRLDFNSRRVEVNRAPASLTKSEYDILAFLAVNPNIVFTRTQILDHVRTSDYPVNDRLVDFMIAGLRKKIHPCGSHIETVRGVGYIFRIP